MKYALYRVLRRVLPPSVQRRLGGSSWTRGLRDALFRPKGNRQLVTGSVRWEDLEFDFTAPLKTLYKAQNTGVENRICRLCRGVLSKAGSAIDVGANYGFITQVIGLSLQPDQQALAVEVDPEVIPALKSSLQRNGLDSKVTIVPQGAGAEDAEGLVTVDQLVLKHGLESVSVLKIDVDGGDFDVLQGSREVLIKHQPVVVIELNEKRSEIYRLLQSCGYRHFMDTAGQELETGQHTENLVASVQPVTIPDRGSWAG